MGKTTTKIVGTLQLIGLREEIERKTAPTLLKKVLTIELDDGQVLYPELRNSKINLLEEEGINLRDRVYLEVSFHGSEKNSKKYNNIYINSIQKGVEEMVLYKTENYLTGSIIDDTLSEGVKRSFTKMTEEQTKYLVSLLRSNIDNNYQHRCMSVYRDGFIYSGDRYRICLSCGDFYKNDEIFYIEPQPIKEFIDAVHNN